MKHGYILSCLLISVTVIATEPDTASLYSGIYHGTPTPASWHEKRADNTFTVGYHYFDHLSDQQTQSSIDFTTQKRTLEQAITRLRQQKVDILAAADLDQHHPRTRYANQMQMLANDAYFDHAIWQRYPNQLSQYTFSRFDLTPVDQTPGIQASLHTVDQRLLLVVYASLGTPLPHHHIQQWQQSLQPDGIILIRIDGYHLPLIANETVSDVYLNQFTAHEHSQYAYSYTHQSLAITVEHLTIVNSMPYATVTFQWLQDN